MPYITLKLAPGITTETTKFAAEGTFVDGNFCRFRYGQPQQIGGWTPFSPVASPLDGIARSIFAWRALDGGEYGALGTNRRLYVLSGGAILDVTPIFNSGSASNPFSTTISTPAVNVHLVANGFAVNDIMNFPGSTSIGGLTITGNYTITTIVDADNFTITAAINATSTVTNGGGTVSWQYLLPTGPSDQTVGFGWNTSTWNTGTWNTPRSSGGIPIDIGQYTFDHWGENLIANRFGAGIYQWVKASGTSVPAALITQAPQICNSILVTQDRFMLAYGSSDPGSVSNFDPLSIKWSTQGDFTNWTPALTNTAGFYRINTANAILCAKYISGNILVFTDLDIYIQQPLQAPLVFGFQQVGTGCGPISKNSPVVQNGVAYWMGNSQFYTFQAGVSPIECTVLRHVFGNINRSQTEKIWGVVNSSFNEITWYYPSTLSNEVDSYVSYNYVERWWTIGSLQRTCGMDVSTLAPSNPILVDATGNIWLHESGDSANGASIGSYLVTAPVDIQTGDQVSICNRCIPDFAYKVPGVNVQLTFTGMSYPESTETFTKGPYLIGENVTKIDFRLRGRQIQMRIDGINGYWQYGGIRINLDADGAR